MSIFLRKSISNCEINFPSFEVYGDPSRFFLLNATIAIDSQALKLMLDTSNPQFFPSSKCIRVLWNRKFRVYERNKTASFHTSFFFNIRPQSGIDHEGFNFMITSYDYMPNNSYGLRLGLFNNSTNDISNSKVLTFFLTYTFDLDRKSVNLLSSNEVRHFYGCLPFSLYRSYLFTF